jgi:hypothetical protein
MPRRIEVGWPRPARHADKKLTSPAPNAQETLCSAMGQRTNPLTRERALRARRYQVHLTESGVQPPTLNSSESALRFFFATTRGRAELACHLARAHYPRKLPRVLSAQKGRLLEAAPGPGLRQYTHASSSRTPRCY